MRSALFILSSEIWMANSHGWEDDTEDWREQWGKVAC